MVTDRPERADPDPDDRGQTTGGPRCFRFPTGRFAAVEIGSGFCSRQPEGRKIEPSVAEPGTPPMEQGEGLRAMRMRLYAPVSLALAACFLVVVFYNAVVDAQSGVHSWSILVLLIALAVGSAVGAHLWLRDSMRRSGERIAAAETKAAESDALFEAGKHPQIVIDSLRFDVRHVNDAARRFLAGSMTDSRGISEMLKRSGSLERVRADLDAGRQARISLSGNGSASGGKDMELVAAQLPISVGGGAISLIAVDPVTDHAQEDLDRALEGLDQQLLAGESQNQILESLFPKIEAYFQCGGLALVTKHPEGGITLDLGAGHALAYAEQMALRWDHLRSRREPIGRAIDGGEPVSVQLAETVGNGWVTVARDLGVERIDVVPLISGGDVIGAMAVFNGPDLQGARGRLMRRTAARIAMLLSTVDVQWRMRLLSTALEGTVNAVFITDQKGRIEWVNGAFTDMTGYSLDEVSGITTSILKSGKHDDHFYQELWDTIQAGRSWRGELVNRRRNGRLYYLRQSITPITDPSNNVTHFVAIQEDITEWRAAEMRSEYLSGHDQLTGLPNRTLLMDRLTQAIGRAERDGRSVALLLLDLDGFKALNDTKGQAFGDGVLVTVAARLDARLRSADTAARMGSDEFAVILESNAEIGASPDDHVAVTASDLMAEIRAIETVKGERVNLSASMGVTRYPGDADNAEDLLKCADVALTACRTNRLQEPQFFSIPTARAMTERVRIRLGLAGAIERKELHLAYQPQIDLQTGRYTGVEALLRWRWTDHDPVSPDKFIPVAEETGLILDIGNWVIEEVCRQLVIWEQQGITDLKVAVNVSARQLESGDLAGHLAACVRDAGIPSDRVEVELTETTLVNETPQIADQLFSLHDQGIGVAIDDFGTGFSSLTYLRRFPISKVKIDRTFIATMTENESDQAIVRAVIGLADNLGLKCIAEGAEEHDQVQFLRELGCQLLQGYFSGKPMAPDELADLLLTNQQCVAWTQLSSEKDQPVRAAQ